MPGHGEGDLLAGSRSTYIATLVERHTRYVMLVKFPNKETETVVSALIAHARQLPGELYRSLTWDRGRETADHQRFTQETNIDVYFCDPQGPWQRGSGRAVGPLGKQGYHSRTQASLGSRLRRSNPDGPLARPKELHCPHHRGLIRAVS